MTLNSVAVVLKLVGQIQDMYVKLLASAGLNVVASAYDVPLKRMPLALPTDTVDWFALVNTRLFPFPVKSVHTEPLTLEAS